MNDPGEDSGDSTNQSELTELRRKLAEAEQTVLALKSRQVDAVLDREGSAVLLRAAQSKLIKSELKHRQSAQTQAAILDALPAQIALLGSDGTILAVNGVWKRFARHDGRRNKSVAVGANYLSICDLAEKEGDTVAREAAAGIRRVLAGEIPLFSQDYARRTGDRPQWSRLMATPLQDKTITGAVLVKVDITDTKIAAEALRKNEERYRLLFDGNPHPMWVYDPVTLRFLAVNHAATEQYGYTREEFLQMTLDDIQSPEGHERLRRTAAGFRHLKKNRGSWQHRRKNGELFDVESNSEAVLFDGQPARLVLALDISERRQAERALYEREAQFRATFEQAAMAIAHTSLEGKFLQVNEKFCEMMGYSADELKQMEFFDLTFPEDRPEAKHMSQAMTAGEHRALVTDRRYRRKDGEVVWTNRAISLVRDAEGQPGYFIMVLDDITQRKQAEFRLRRLNRLYSVLSKVAEFIVRAEDRGQLYAMTCRVLVEEGLLRMALVAENAAPGVPLKIIAAHGEIGEYVANLVVTSDDSPTGCGPIGTSLRTGTHQVCNDFASDPRMAPWREAGADNFGSVAAFPLKIEGVVVGALALYSHEQGYFEADEVELMVTVARDVSFAVETWQNEERRRAAEESIRVQARMLDLIAEAVITTDVSGKVIYANRHAEELFGWPHDELVGAEVMELKVPGSARGLPGGILAELQQGRTWSGEYLAKRGDGSVFPAMLSGSPLLDKANQLIGLIWVTSDITERRRAEDALRANEERFRLLAKATSDAIWDLDVATNVLWWNEGFEYLFGQQADDENSTMEGWIRRLHPEDAPRVLESFQNAIDGSSTFWSAEYRFRRGDGSYAFVLDRGYLIRDAAGKALRMIGGVTDLTERNAAAHRLAWQAALLENARDAIIVRDLEHKVTYWNKSAERVYGWSAEEAKGRSSRDFIFKNHAEFDDCIEKLLRTGEWSGELTQTTKDGRSIIVESRWTLMKDGSDQPESVLVINTDVTERKKLEQQFLRAQRIESIGTLAGGIAHDLNNLLAPITMGVGLLKLQPLSESQLRVVTTIERSAARGTNLVKQVLSFARGVEGARVSVHLGHIIKEVQSITQMTFPKNISIETNVPAGLSLVTGDPTQLTQVLMNLCVNARDAMPEGGHLSISVRETEIDEQFAVMNQGVTPGRYLVVEVTDTGSGIPKEIIDRIFEPFFTTKELGHGTGLGLSTVLGIVRSHGGFVNVYSEPGKGAVFKVHLPADRQSEPAHGAVALSPELPHGNGELVLVVDDEKSILGITQQTLESFGYRVLVAEDGAQAIGIFAEHRAEIALVLTDMMMPVMDGLALIAALKRIEPKVRIIAASGLKTNATLAKATHAGIKRFLAKPYSAGTLLKAFKEELSSAP